MAVTTSTAGVAASTPLFLNFPETYDPNMPGNFSRSTETPKRQIFDYPGLTLDLPQILVNLLAPSIVFFFASTLMSFFVHYRFPKFVYVWVWAGILPACFAYFMLGKAMQKGASTRFHKLSLVLFLCAFVSGAIFGELNFWFCLQPFYFIEGLKTYSNIDPSGVSGLRLMDAGKVHFNHRTRLATDMGMSFTSTWDIYCVAPITTPEGLPSQGSTLANYDLWAVGVNCCKSGTPSFSCGEFNDVNARAALRQIGDTQRVFFRLAVQQAEAAYNIQARHPIFFYWVKDPMDHESLLYTTGFTNWIMANSAHFVLNTCAVVAFVMMYHAPPRGTVDFLPKL